MSDTKINQYLRRGSTAVLGGASAPSAPTPVGTDAPHGYFQYDTTTGLFEGWDGAAWDPLTFTGNFGATDNAIPRADGTGGRAIQSSLITISDTGALGLPDDVTQVFNPGTTNSGINVGTLAGDPSSADNGDVWYNSSTHKYRGVENGVVVDLGGGGGGGGAGWRMTLKPGNTEPPSSNAATLSILNSQPTLDFDQTTAETAVWSEVLPFDYAGGGITVYAYWTAAVTSGDVGWTVEIERQLSGTTDLNSDSFASAQTITAATVPGTIGIITRTSVAITDGANMDSAAAGDAIRVRVKRDVANDTAAGDARLVRVEIVES